MSQKKLLIRSFSLYTYTICLISRNYNFLSYVGEKIWALQILKIACSKKSPSQRKATQILRKKTFLVSIRFSLLKLPIDLVLS